MLASDLSAGTIGWVAIATGVTGLLGFVFIVLFFAVGQPFGTLNDYCIALTAILSAVLIGLLYPWHHAQRPVLSIVALVIALVGVLLVLAGAALAISGVRGWYLSGLYMAAGNALIGLWLVALNYSALREPPFPRGLAILGIVSGAILALGLVTVPAILRGIDSKEYQLSLFNSIWWTGSLGYLALYPLWCVLLGRILLLR